MIVWGGGYSGYFNTGGQYDPRADTWTTTSTSNAPSARTGHTAVWSGDNMFVWGGLGASGVTNTGGKYNPDTNSWTGTSRSHAPSVRSGHVAVWTDNQMIVWGGVNNVGNALGNGGTYCGQGNPHP